MAKHNHFPKPKTGGKPKLITTVNPPGGPFTPGAKAARPTNKQRGKSRRVGTTR